VQCDHEIVIWCGAVLTSDDRCDPNGIETHALDVVELGLQTGKGAAAVRAQVGAGIAARVVAAAGDAVRQGKVDVA
jgi:hypothetical protein